MEKRTFLLTAPTIPDDAAGILKDSRTSRILTRIFSFR